VTLKEQKHLFKGDHTVLFAGILGLSMGARNRVGVGLSYLPAELNRLAETIPWNRFLGVLKLKKYYTHLIQAVNRVPKGFFNGITYPVIDIYQRNFHILYMFFIFVFKRKSGKTKQRNNV
jgi:hypothetical protein